MPKTKYKLVLSILQNLINPEYSHSDVSKDLAEKGIKISANALSNRASNDGYLKEEEILILEKKYNINLSDINTNGFIAADYYPYVFGSCGSGTFVLSEQKEVMQVPVNLITGYSKIKKYSVINARGDSMQPFINDMDKLIVEHYQGEQITDNHIYVFCYNDEIFIKRLSKNVDEIIIKSDNPDPAYRTRIIEKENINNIFIIGEIVGLIRDMRR